MMLSEEWPPSKPNTIHLKSPIHDLGYITGLTCLDKTSTNPRCNYYGGIPYAQPQTDPTRDRFRKAQSLPSNHRYGTSDKPEDFSGKVGVCPQPQPDEDKKTNYDDWSEDCLRSNIWVPIGNPPDQEKGWPVLFFIHGGYLQFGHPNGSDYMGLLDTPGKCIIVVPGYRLNVFGFVASEELEKEGGGIVGNYGFWDQRMALEWVRDNIGCFGGDAGNLTISGLSAGAHSVFQQLAYDIFLPKEQRIVKRAVMHSNSPGMQPKTIEEAQIQFNDLLTAVHIPLSLSSEEKLSRLRQVPARQLIEACQTIRLHQFRATTDNQFIPASLFTTIEDGTFAKAMQAAGVTLLLGEVCDENTSYAGWYPPTSDTISALHTRLCGDYSTPVVDALVKHYCPNNELPFFNGVQCKDWPEAFGRIYADIQVHALQRGFLSKLVEHGAACTFRRYRVEWRAKSCDKNYPIENGVTHGTDLALWFWGDGVGLELLESEEGLVRNWCKPYWSWIHGEGWDDGHWGRQHGGSNGGEKQVRRLKSDGSVDLWEDTDWARGVEVWNVVRKAQQ